MARPGLALSVFFVMNVCFKVSGKLGKLAYFKPKMCGANRNIQSCVQNKQRLFHLMQMRDIVRFPFIMRPQSFIPITMEIIQWNA